MFTCLCQLTDLIAHVEGKEQHQHASGRVASVVSGPVVVDVFEECWVEYLDLVEDKGFQPRSPNTRTRLYKVTYSRSSERLGSATVL